MTKRPLLARPTETEISGWEQRITAELQSRPSLPLFKGDYCYVTRNIDGLPTLVRFPVGQSLDDTETVVDPRKFAQDGQRLTIQSWQFLKDDILAFCLADGTEHGELRFLDVNSGRTVGRSIQGFRWGALAYYKAGDAIFHTVHHPTPLTPGAVEWRVRIGGPDGRDVTIPAPDQPTAPKLVQWPVFGIHEHRGHQWLVVVSGPQAGELKDLYLADLSASEGALERPRFISSLRTTLRGSLVVSDGKATFISTNMGRLPRGAVFQAPISSLTNRKSWRVLVPMPEAPGAHLNSVTKVGTGRQTRLLVHRTQNGAAALDVHTAKGRRLYSLHGPPDGRTAALFGTASAAPAKQLGGDKSAPDPRLAARLRRRLRIVWASRQQEPPRVYVSWGDAVASHIHEYALGRKHADVRPQPGYLASTAAEPQRIATTTRVWRAAYADGKKVATARLILAEGTEPSRSFGTVVEQYSHYASPQEPHGGFSSPQPYTTAWLRRGGGVLTVMLQDPVTASTDHEAAAGIAALLTAGTTAGLVTPRRTILTGTSAGASTVAMMMQEHPNLFGLGVSLHGSLSRGEGAARVGVGPNVTHEWGLGPPATAAEHGGLERLDAQGLSVTGATPPFYAFGGGKDTRVPWEFHGRPWIEELHRRGVDALGVEEPEAGHHFAGTVTGALRQSGISLAVYEQHLAMVPRAPGSRSTRAAAEVLVRHELTTPLPATAEVRVAAAAFLEADVSQLVHRKRRIVEVELWNSGNGPGQVPSPPTRDRNPRELGRTYEK